MTQLDLFAARLARSSDPATSQIAAEEVQPKLGRLRQAMLDAIEELGEATATEAAEMAREKHDMRGENCKLICKALVRMGRIKKVAERESSVTKEAVPVFAIKPPAVRYRIEEHVGKRYGKLVVVRAVVVTCQGKPRTHWECECDCGNTTVAPPSSIVCGRTRSCRCGQFAQGAINGRTSNRVHGHKTSDGTQGSITYVAWQAMKQRCHYPKHKGYAQYGGAGIAVCERWRDSFAAFLEDVGERPSKDHTLDRYPNSGGNYEPGNVRWANKKEQARNQKSNRLITIDGETKCLVEWVEDPRCTVSAHAIGKRLAAGVNEREAVFRPMTDQYVRAAKGLRAAAARRRVKQSGESLEAYDSIPLTEVQAAVIEAASRFPDGFTHEEIAAALPQYARSTVRGRCAELAGAHRGVIVKTNRVKKTSAGHKTAVWSLSPAYLIAAD